MSEAVKKFAILAAVSIVALFGIAVQVDAAFGTKYIVTSR